MLAHLQTAQFAVGSRLFRLTDAPTNTLTNATTSAEKNYEASGLSVTQQDKTISSRSLDLASCWTTFGIDHGFTSSVNGFNVQYLDPLAETFLVDSSLFPQGVFITSLDFCFATVPTDDIPIILELRPVNNGYPSSNEILPCVSSEGLAIVVKASGRYSYVCVAERSMTPAVYTRFDLPAPVYLLPGREYAIVLRSDSNQYTVYTAELGSTVIGSDAKIGKQPYAGSFFKSRTRQRGRNLRSKTSCSVSTVLCGTHNCKCATTPECLSLVESHRCERDIRQLRILSTRSAVRRTDCYRLLR
jgi:hypothetical protein